MKNFKEKLLLLSFIIFSSFVTAQDIKISGKVVDASDQMPLIGASVIIEGTTKGAVADFDGMYSISAKAGDVLVFSYLGYEDIKIKVGSSTTINASLKVKADVLNEVVVVAYGTSSRKVITGAQTSIKAETFKDRPIVTIEDALQGNASGLLVQSSSGQPGSAANINIRGIGSLSGSTQPLVVIDGFPVEEIQKPGSGGALDYSSQISPFAFINPNDIESVEILKDASATALYGIRGANGVILITTKKGKPGNTKINYSTYLGIRNVPKQLDMMNFSQYVGYVQERTNNPLYLSDDNTPYVFDPNVPSINWQDRLYRTGLVQDHSLSVQGGAENTRFLLSSSFLQDKSVIIETDFKKYNVRLNIDQKVSDKLKFGTTLAYNFIGNKGLPTDGREGTATGTVMQALLIRPYMLADPDTQAYFRRAGVAPSQISAFTADGTGSGPESMARATDIYNKNSRFMSSVWAHWNITNELTLKLFAGNDMFNGKDQQFYSRSTGWGFNVGGVAVNAEFLNRSWSTENVLNYKTQFYNHKFDIDLGGTLRENRFEWWRVESSYFGTEYLRSSRLDNGLIARAASMVDMYKTMGFLARMNYSFKDKFIVTLSNRYDGSSRFITDQWQSFPSLALAYNLGEESFFNNSKTVNLFKIRGSVGEVGNSQVPTTGSVPVMDKSNYTINGVEVLGQSPLNIANKNLSWETTVQMNGGIDLNLFANSVTITADYYIKKTRDLLLNTPIPNIVGQDDAWRNIGEVQNSGIEFSLTTINLKKSNFEWNSSFNITSNNSKINKLGQGGQPIYIDVNFDEIIKDEVILKEGGAIGDLYGFVQEGLYLPSDYINGKDGALLPSVASRGISEQPGEVKFKDINGDGKITSEDRTVIGNTLPDFFGSLTNNFIYKNFELNVMFQYSIGNDVFNATRTRTERFNISDNQSVKYLERWTPENPTSTQYSTFTSMAASSTFVEDASFIRLRNVRLGYNFPKPLIDKLKISNFKMYISADNLAVFTKYTGYDPEISSNVKDAKYSSVLSQGFDYGGFPRARTFTFGLNVGF